MSPRIYHPRTAVDQNSQGNINRLVVAGEQIKLGEVSSWADASRSREHAPEEEGKQEGALASEEATRGA